MSDREATSSFACPVCGFPDLHEPPWHFERTASYEICPCCLIEFGYHDWGDHGTEADRKTIHREWRKAWVKEGMPWRGIGAPPDGWDPRKQLRDLLGDDTRE